MGEIMDKQKKDSIISKKILLFYLIIFLIALVSGTFFNLILSDKDTKLVSDYLTNFITLIKSNNINYIFSFVNTVSLNSIYIFIIWILGFTIIGIPIIILIYFFKTFILGFSISILISNFKIKGILYSFIYIFPHVIINLMLIILLSIISIYVSTLIYKSVFKKKKINYNILKKYVIILFVFLFITILTSLYEVILLPKVFNLLI